MENQSDNLDLIVEEQSLSEKNTQIPEEEKGVFWGEIIKIFIWSFLIIVPVRTFLFQPFFVKGASMEPNFHDGEYLIVNELGYKETSVGFGNSEFFKVESFKDFQRGDVVVFRYPKDPDQFFIKRVVGLPGERIDVKKNKITIYNQDNPTGFLLNEDEYLASFVKTKGSRTFILNESEYVVLGDNREHSSDSRLWGAISKEDVVGKVLLRSWPFNKFRIF